MNKTYYDTVDQLEKMSVDRDYIQGWIGGYLQNPQREEQRISDAYTAGYDDGSSKHTDQADNWRQG